MAHRYADIGFTDHVKAAQSLRGSRRAYAEREASAEDVNHRLGSDEAAFIAIRDSFYMATVSETGWPYVQHRGGPAGFLRVLDETTLGFADFAGNRQYMSVGNLATNDRVSLFLMDYPRRARLKLFGRARFVEMSVEDPDAPMSDDAKRALLERLAPENYKARIERGVVISVEGFDWNCPQHITPRFTAEEVAEATEPLRRRIAELEAALAAKE